jgi:hypothetical protein
MFTFENMQFASFQGNINILFKQLTCHICCAAILPVRSKYTVKIFIVKYFGR